MMKHTPTPWSYGTKISGSENHKGFYIRSKGGTYILHEIHPLDEDGKEGQANAAFIVRAVNAHEELLSAAKNLLAHPYDREGVNFDAKNRLEVAIAKAEG